MKYYCIYCKKEYESPSDDHLVISDATIFSDHISFRTGQKCHGQATDVGNGNKYMCGGYDYSMPIKILTPKNKS